MTLKQRMLTNWHLGRVVRLAIGLMLLGTGIQSKDWIMGSFSLWFLYQAVTDTGCCGSGGCAPDYRSKMTKSETVAMAKEEVIEFEEVK